MPYTTPMKNITKIIIITFASIIIFLSPFIIIPIFLWLFNILIPTVPQEKIKNITVFISEYGLKLNEYINYFILFLQIVVTAVFSYVLWKSTLRSNELAEKIDEKDDNKEKELIRENALIVYYDLTLGLKDLAKLYESRIIKKTNHNPKRIFLSAEWIKNVALLKDNLTNDEINKVYSLYGELLIIKELLEDKDLQYNYKDLDDEVKRLFKSIMNINIIDYPDIFDFNIHDVQSYINNSYFYLLEKLRLLTYTEKQILTKQKKDRVYQLYIDNNLYYEGEMADGKFDGQGTIWYKNLMGRTYKKLEGKFVGGLFMEGLRQEEHSVDQTFFKMQFVKSNVRVSGQVYDKEGKLLADGKYDNDGYPIEGFFTLFKDNGKSKYTGKLKDGKYHGTGTFYGMNTSKEGIWDYGRFIEGIEHNVRVADSEGFDYYAEEAYIEQKIQELEMMHEEDEEVLSAKWTEYANMEYKDGECRIIEGTRKKEYEF